MKEDEYTKSIAKNQVCAIFHMRDIPNNLLKFINFVCPSEVHKHDHHKPAETLFWAFVQMREFVAWGTHNDYNKTRNV